MRDRKQRQAASPSPSPSPSRDDDEPQQAHAQRVLLRHKSKKSTRGAGPAAGAAHAGTAPATAAPVHGPMGEVDALRDANDHVERALLPRWQQATDQLQLGALGAVARDAMGSANRTDPMVADLMMRPTPSAMIEMGRNRSLWTSLQTLQFHGEPIHGPREAIGSSTAAFIQERYQLLARAIDATLQILAECDKAERDDHGYLQLSGSSAMLVARTMGLHGDATEQGFIWQALQQHGHAGTVRRVGGLTGALILEGRTARTDEGAATQGWAHEIAPERMAALHHAANEISDAVDGQVEGNLFYLSKLKQFDKPERGALVRILQTRGLLHNMVRLGGDEVKWAIRHSPGFGGWRYDEGRATVEPKKTLAGAAGNAVKSIPGASAHFAAGVYSGLSHIPVVGGTFKRSAAAFRELGDAADDSIGVSEETRRLRNSIAEGAGRVDAMILEIGVTGEISAGQAAAAFNAARGASVAYDAYSTGEKIASAVGQIKDGFATLENGWSLFSGVLNELSAAASDALIDEATGDPDQSEHAVDHLSKIFDLGISKLGAMASGKLTAKGKKAEKKRGTFAADRDKQRGEMAEQGASPQLKIEVALLAAANKQLLAATTEEERAIARAEMEAHAERVRQLAEPGSFGRAALVEAQDEDKPAASQHAGFSAGIKKLGTSLVEQVEEAIIDFGVAALTESKNELVKQLKAHWKSGKPLSLDARRMIAMGVAKGASTVAVDRAGRFVRFVIGGVIHEGVEQLIEEHYPGMEGLADLLDDPIEDLLKYLEEKLEVDAYVTEPIEAFILKLFGEQPAT